MDALDISMGLHNLNGNETLYKKLLRRFADSNSNVPNELRQNLSDGKLEDAQRLAHTLKGVAASMGANVLSGAAMQVEQTLKSGQLDEAELATMQAELARALADVESYLA